MITSLSSWGDVLQPAIYDYAVSTPPRRLTRVMLFSLLTVHIAFLDVVRSGDPIISCHLDGSGVCEENTGRWRFSLAAQQIDMSASASALFAV